MSAAVIDYDKLFRSDLPPAAAKPGGFPPFNFVGGHNDPVSVPVEDLIAAATRAMRRDGRSLAKYGLDSGPLGHKPLREFLVDKLKRDAGITCTADEILITQGSLQGLDFVNGVLIAPGDTVIIEEMTYGGAITRLQRMKANIVGVPVDHDGLRADKLREALLSLKSQGIKPKYVYTIPTVQNPTATVMSPGRRQQILDIAGEFGVPVFEDDCYADLTWDGQRPVAMRGMVNDDRVIHIGSFSKTIAPALRLGFIVAGWNVMSRILAIKSDGGSGALEQMTLAEYCPTHFDEHVQALRKVLRRKVTVMMEALREQFGDEVEFQDPAGGIFLWMRLPEGLDTKRLEQASAPAGVTLNPGAEWMTDTVAGKRWLRLCFAHPSEEVIREGVGRLAEICHREFGVPRREEKGHR
jgi:2-aminoadipate transaminase